MSISRRNFIVASTFIATGLATGTAALGAEGDVIEVTLDNPGRLAELSGEKLRAVLVRSVRLRVKLSRPAKAQLLAGRMENGALKEVFASDSFEIRPGQAALPGDRLFPRDMLFPDDMLIPGDMIIPGDMLIPGDMIIPGNMIVPIRRALEPVAKGTLGRHDAANGLVFFVMVDAKGARGRGLGIPTVQG